MGVPRAVRPHGDPAALGLIFPASPTSQTGASRRLQSTGNVIVGNLNAAQQTFESNERQSAQTSQISEDLTEQYSVQMLAAAGI